MPGHIRRFLNDAACAKLGVADPGRLLIPGMRNFYKAELGEEDPVIALTLGTAQLGLIQAMEKKHLMQHQKTKEEIQKNQK